MTQDSDLSDRQVEMLEAGEFHVDGWCGTASLYDADDLEKRGYVTCFESGSDEAQYTALNYTVTEAGIARRERELVMRHARAA